MPPPTVVIVRDLWFRIRQLTRLDPVLDLVADETDQGGMLLESKPASRSFTPSKRTLAHLLWGDQRATPTGSDCPRMSSVSSEKTA